MAPTLYCVRHAQGFHNLGTEFHTLRDPKLTPLGEEQCQIARQRHFSDQSKISLVIASPLSRTIHTAYVMFGPALENGKAVGHILAVPDVQEISDLPCDTGSDIDDLRRSCDEHRWPVNLSLLSKDWNVKTDGNRYAPSNQAIDSRARDARRLIREKMRELAAAGDDDAQVILVTHGGYLHYFTEDWENSNKLMGTGWENCETRAYTFQMGIDSNDKHAHLTETPESRNYRGLDHPMYPIEQQRALFRQGMQNWIAQGLHDGGDIVDDTDIRPDAAEQQPTSGNMGIRRSSDVGVTA